MSESQAPAVVLGGPSDDPGGIDTIRQLRQSLERAAELSKALEEDLEKGPPVIEEPKSSDELDVLKRRLDESEKDRAELVTQMIEAEHQAGRLMNLYVATYQLHANLDPGEVQNTIAEIARDLLGAERFVLILKDDDGTRCEVALASGFDEGDAGPYSGSHYEGGDALVDQTLADGVLRLAANGEQDAEALAAVPLRVEETTVGALAILSLVSHRVTPLSDDRDILDLIAAHAASALFAARVCSDADSKVRTLESLVKLTRGH